MFLRSYKAIFIYLLTTTVYNKSHNQPLSAAVNRCWMETSDRRT